MYPSNFDYQRAASVAEAIQKGSSDGAKFLAGGHSLLPALKLRLNEPESLVDIGRLDALKGISVSGSSVKIGALSTHAQIASSADVKKHAPALASACGQVGDPAVRNRGTLGGNLAHADPASDPPTVVLALGGKLHLQGSGGNRVVAAEDFFLDLFTTDLHPGELITAVEVPSIGQAKSAYAKMAHPASRYAVVGVCVVLEVSGGKCSKARVAVGGATPKATLSAAAANALVGSSLDAAALDAAAKALSADLSDVMGDVYAPEDYRRAMAGVYLKRAVRAAMG